MERSDHIIYPCRINHNSFYFKHIIGSFEHLVAPASPAAGARIHENLMDVAYGLAKTGHGRTGKGRKNRHTDRAFLWSHMRALHEFLHYRNVDVSTLKELIRRWYPDRWQPPKKAGSHQARADIHESIAELRYYRDNFLA